MKHCKTPPQCIKSTKIDDYRILNAKSVNAKRFPDGYIYFIHLHETDLYKIGVSQKPYRRVRDIESSNPHEVLMLALKYYENAYEIETKMHESIKEYYVRHEWFKLPFNIASDIFFKIKGIESKEEQQKEINSLLNYAST